MRLSRWGRSSYETTKSIAAEAVAVGPFVEVLPDGHDAEVIVVNSKRRVDTPFLDGLPSCRLVVTASSGYEHLDLRALADRGIDAARLPQARAGAVVDTALGMMLTGLRGLGPLHRAARAGRWERPRLGDYGLVALAGEEVGVVGAGFIGRRMIAALQALGARVLACDPAGLPPGVRQAAVDEMLQRCVAITLHCDLNPSTEGLLDARALGPGIRELVLVNTARGPLVDLHAAVAALHAGRLRALCLDVFPTEPPDRMAALAADPRVLLTPHAAGFHGQLLPQLAAELAQTVGAFVASGSLPHPLL